ncbi:MAG: CoA ester lyase [Rhizobiales bacterium]|nr:CoA ester lyase [Hyphomicrobiales bacterium]
MTDFRPRRSALYMPGARARVIAKGRDLPADALIFDLEDSALPDEKDAARENVRAALAEGGYGRRELIVRVNPLSSPWGTEDVMAAIAAGADAVLVPKIESADDVRALARALSAADAGDRVAIWVMIETPRALLDVSSIAASADEQDVPLKCLVLGTNDIAKETGVAMVAGRGPMLSWMSMVVLSARAYGLAVLDGVYNAFEDTSGYEAECRQAADMGMDGKTLIHPAQIAAANEVFAPSPDEVAKARRLIAAFALPENRDRGVINLEGEMVERLHGEMAERIVAIADAIAAAAKAE